MDQLYSHSRLSSFEDCPRKFQYRYVLRIPSESESVEGFVGKRVHEVLERLYLATGRGHVPSLAQVIRRFRLLWEQHYDPERVRIVRRENDAAFYRSHGERCLSNFYRRFYPFDGDETLGLEERLTFSLDAGGGYRIQGIVDRIVRARDGSLEIHDYKTSARIPPQEALDRDRQLGLYQLGLEQRHPDRPIRLVWHYLLHGQVRTSARTPEQLASLREQTRALIDRIRVETRFEPRPGPLCGWCEYNDRCPAASSRRSEARPSPAVVDGAGQLMLL